VLIMSKQRPFLSATIQVIMVFVWLFVVAIVAFALKPALGGAAYFMALVVGIGIVVLLIKIEEGNDD